MIAGNVPQHLVIGARTGFLRATRETPALWQRVAMEYVMDGASTDLVDLGAAPMPVKNKTGMTVQDFVERTQNVTPESWDITVFISADAIKDDRTGTLEQRVRSAGANFNKHINKLVFQALNAGDAATYGVCYDGKNLFADDHADKGAAYITAQDNKFDLALDATNFETVYVAHSMFRDDQGEIMGITPDLLVVPPHLERAAIQICQAQLTPSALLTAEVNPYANKLGYITAPWLDSTAWFTVASSDPIKPIILAMRERPHLQSAWFDPAKPDGGHYYFKFYARYNIAYGDWRLVAMGKS